MKIQPVAYANVQKNNNKPISFKAYKNNPYAGYTPIYSYRECERIEEFDSPRDKDDQRYSKEAIEEVDSNMNWLKLCDYKTRNALNIYTADQYRSMVEQAKIQYKKHLETRKRLFDYLKRGYTLLTPPEGDYTKSKTMTEYVPSCPLFMYESLSDDYCYDPIRLTGPEKIKERKEAEKRGEKVCLEPEDFQWHYDENTGEAYVWELNNLIFTRNTARDDEWENLAACCEYLFPEDPNCQDLYNFSRCRDHRYTRDENQNNRVLTHKTLQQFIADVRQKRKELNETTMKIQKDFLKRDVEFQIQRQEVESRFFSAIQREKENPDQKIEIPNGILIFGESEFGKNEMQKWIETHGQDIRLKKAACDPSQPQQTLDDLTAAMQEAESYYQVTGKRTIIELDSSFNDLLSNYDSRQNRIAAGRFKNLAERAAQKYHATLLFKVHRNIEDFDPSMVGGQRFNIKLRLDMDYLTEEERKSHKEATEKQQWYQDAKYCLPDLCRKIVIKCERPIDLDDADNIYEALIGGYFLFKNETYQYTKASDKPEVPPVRYESFEESDLNKWLTDYYSFM